MGKSGIKITIDDKTLNRQIEKALKQNPVAATKAVMKCVLDLAGESASRAPVESGDLRNNCHGQVQGTTVFENQAPTGSPPSASDHVSGSVGYSLPYAARQHEDLSLKHDKENGRRITKATRYKTKDGVVTTYAAASTVNMVAGGEPKYLEKPFQENKQKYINHIKKAVLDNLK